MATFTFTSVGDFFGIGTSVSAYVPAGNPESASPVSGSAIATASVASDGSLTFTGLADDTRYVAYDVSSGKRKAFRTLPLVVVSDSGVISLAKYGAIGDGVTDCAGPMRRAVAAAAAWMTITGRGATIELPTGVLAWSVADTATKTYQTAGETRGVGLPPGLAARLRIKGQGIDSTTIKLVGCRSAFYADFTGANIHATTVSGSSTVTATSVPQGAIAVGQAIVGAGIPANTVIASYNAGTGAIVLGQMTAPGTPVTATADGTDIGLVGYGFDTFQNLTFEDFSLDNNGQVGRVDVLFGNRIGGNRTEYYKSFQDITVRRIKSWGVPYDATQATTYKCFLGLVGQHAPGDVYANSTLTSTKNIFVEDVDLRDYQNGLYACSYVGASFGQQKHYYDNIRYNRCRVDHTYTNQVPATTLQQTSFYICGSGYGDDCEITGCYSKGSADDGIELGAMQRILVDDCHIKDAWFEGIMFRNSQDPIDLRTQEITVRDTLIEATAALAATAGTPWARPFRFTLDSAGGLGNATGYGRFRFERVTYKLSDFALSDLTGRTQENDLGFNVYGPIYSVEMLGCKVHIKNFNYDSAANNDLAALVSNISPPILNSAASGTNTVLHSPATFKVRDFEAVMSGGGATSTGQFLVTGLWPIGQGIFDVDGMEMRVDSMSGNLNVASIAQIGKGGTYSLIKLRNVRGIRGGGTFGIGSNSFYPIRVWNSGTWLQSTTNGNSLVDIDGCDFLSFGNQSTDIDLANAPSNWGAFMRLGKRNRYSGSYAASAGGAVTPAASFTMQSTHDTVGVTDTTAARTITLPNAQKTPWRQIIVITDESGAAATNNITVSRAGGDTFADAATTKVINTNGGSLRLMSLGTLNKWAVV